MCTAARGDRAISPAVGVVLLVGIALLLAIGSAGFLFGLAEEPDPAPNVVFELENDEDVPGVRYLRHEQGDRLDGDRVEIRGIGNQEALKGSRLAAGERERVVPVADSIEIVWFGDDDTSYLLWEATVQSDASVPAPDVGCSWVDAETNGGTDDVTIDGQTVNCDVQTDKVIEVRNGGAILGETASRAKLVDGDDAALYGDVTVEEGVDVQRGTVAGSVRAHTEGVKLAEVGVQGGVRAAKRVELLDGSNASEVRSDGKGAAVRESEVRGSVAATEKVDVDDGTVAGSISTGGEIEVTASSSIGGDLTSDDDQVKVLDSTVDGDVSTDGLVKLDGATVDGEVLVDDADFDCSDSTVAGQDCSSYEPGGS